MRKRISVLVAIGFAFLLGLGVLTSLAMIAGLRETMSRAEASQASALEVRASVRSLRADYLASGDAVSRLMLEPGLVDAWAAKRQADENATEHLAAATRATRHPELRAVLEKLDAHDRDVTNRIEDELLGLVGTDPAEAQRAYFEEYLRARAVNLGYVEAGANALPEAPEMRNERITFLDRNGTRIPMSVSAALLRGAGGEAVGIVWVAHDMRDQLRMLEEMEAARDTALEASRIKSEFLANMSHEIRTPMN